jgi:adenosylmethionine-8-amino-7-oxononanoate aminotransferase
VRIVLEDGREIIDGMASWWSAIHGYNHPVLNAAVSEQVDAMAHVMFGGLTHRPAAELAKLLISLTPAGLDVVFFSDSGSVAVEVAIKMALQYWTACDRPGKNRLLTVRGGYHGDTFGAMAVCDPDTGMHSLFTEVLPRHIFVERPAVRFDADWSPAALAPVRAAIERHAEQLAAVIIEPVVQGAGGMWFYHPQYLRGLRGLCDEYELLLICDEIATGFGRTGRLFATEHAGISPDIMCLGKAMTGGYLTGAATLATAAIAGAISAAEPGAFMHGPTFMANPLMCSVARASIELLVGQRWRDRVAAIEAQLRAELAPCSAMKGVAEVRVLGAIGVVEVKEPVDMYKLPHLFVDRGVWVRPFGRLVYVMPPFVITPDELTIVTAAIRDVVAGL